MLNIILIAIGLIAATIAIVWLIDKFVPSNLRLPLNIVLWAGILYVGYLTFNSIYAPIEFNKVKSERYRVVIDHLIDVRNAQLAHRQITGEFALNFDSLVKFIDTAEYTITQRKDSTVVDKELTRRYGGVVTTKEIVVIDTLGFVSVKDSLFKSSDRYKTMMNIPVGKEGNKVIMEAGFILESDVKIPVFEALVKKEDILYDQDHDLVVQENQVVSVDGVNGDAIRVGSLTEVKTNGNWPKTYGDN